RIFSIRLLELALKRIVAERIVSIEPGLLQIISIIHPDRARALVIISLHENIEVIISLHENIEVGRLFGDRMSSVRVQSEQICTAEPN
ncbi:hypothetical protein Tco_1499722, partial [Tanacetum coccineum]